MESLGGPSRVVTVPPLLPPGDAHHPAPTSAPPCAPAPGRASSSRQLPRRSLDPKSALLLSLSSSGGRSADWNHAGQPVGLPGRGEGPGVPSQPPDDSQAKFTLPFSSSLL